MGEPGSSDHPGTAIDPRNSRRLIEIALEVGYTSPTHFARVFRRVVGVTPTVYGLNGQRAYYIIALSPATYEYALYK
jgi:AraC-like DNA-binding protein